jgi:tetratricopeptide (TPR) repeat protein
VVAVAGGIEKTHGGQIAPEIEVDALCRGAAVLSREENRIAARALLWAAVAIDPQNFVAHRRLAAALLNADDFDGAADEYARFIELLLKEHDVRRAAGELAYARSFLGEMPQLSSAAAHSVPLGDIAKVLESQAPPRSSAPLALADYAASRAPFRALDNWGRPAPPAVTESTTTQGSWRTWRPWSKERSAEFGIGESILLVSLGIAAGIAVFAMSGIR